MASLFWLTEESEVAWDASPRRFSTRRQYKHIAVPQRGTRTLTDNDLVRANARARITDYPLRSNITHVREGSHRDSRSMSINMDNPQPFIYCVSQPPALRDGKHALIAILKV